MTDTLIDRLQKLANHLYELDSGSGEAQLLGEAINTIRASQINTSVDDTKLQELVADTLEAQVQIKNECRTNYMVAAHHIIKVLQPYLAQTKASVNDDLILRALKAGKMCCDMLMKEGGATGGELSEEEYPLINKAIAAMGGASTSNDEGAIKNDALISRSESLRPSPTKASEQSSLCRPRQTDTLNGLKCCRFCGSQAKQNKLQFAKCSNKDCWASDMSGVTADSWNKREQPSEMPSQTLNRKNVESIYDYLKRVCLHFELDPDKMLRRPKEMPQQCEIPVVDEASIKIMLYDELRRATIIANYDCDRGAQDLLRLLESYIHTLKQKKGEMLDNKNVIRRMGMLWMNAYEEHLKKYLPSPAQYEAAKVYATDRVAQEFLPKREQGEISDTVEIPRSEWLMLQSKAKSTLGNNLCPDHRDKQHGKPCLACTIEGLESKLKRESGNRMTADEGADIIRRATEHCSLTARYPYRAFAALQKVADIFKKTEIEGGSQS